MISVMRTKFGPKIIGGIIAVIAGIFIFSGVFCLLKNKNKGKILIQNCHPERSEGSLSNWTIRQRFFISFRMTINYEKICNN